MPLIARSSFFAIGLIFAGVTANAQPYSSWYTSPGYGGYAYPADGYSTNYNYYPWDNWNRYYYPPATPYADPYVAARPYSDSAGPAASGHTGY
jgi:hypothetical protein